MIYEKERPAFFQFLLILVSCGLCASAFFLLNQIDLKLKIFTSWQGWVSMFMVALALDIMEFVGEIKKN